MAAGNRQGGLEWKGDDLLQWQARVIGLKRGSQMKAAEELRVPIQTYRHYLSGRRRIPGSFELLCRYREKFGNLSDG